MRARSAARMSGSKKLLSVGSPQLASVSNKGFEPCPKVARMDLVESRKPTIFSGTSGLFLFCTYPWKAIPSTRGPPPDCRNDCRKFRPVVDSMMTLGLRMMAWGSMPRMIWRASCAMRTVWATLPVQVGGLAASFQISQYLMWPVVLLRLWVAMAVTKSFQCWFDPVPSRLRSLGGSQAPGETPQLVSVGLLEAQEGVRPNVYRVSTLCRLAFASHLSSAVQL